jgi:hypothetical protein
LADDITQPGGIERTVEFGASQQYVQQFVVAQLEKLGQRAYILIGKLMLVGIKIPRNDKVIFEQASARPPTQARTFQLG